MLPPPMYPGVVPGVPGGVAARGVVGILETLIIKAIPDLRAQHPVTRNRLDREHNKMNLCLQ